MTIQEMILSDKIFLAPADISQILECDPQAIRDQAQRDPGKLGFSVIVQGSRVRIPRIPFLRYIGVI